MTRPATRLFLPTAVVFAIAVPAVSRAGVVVNAWNLQTLAFQQNNTPVIDSTVSIPFMQTSTDVDGGCSAVSDYNFDFDGVNGSFQFGFDHDRSAILGALASGTGTLDFDTPTGPMKYAFFGDYNLSGTGWLSMQVELTDLTLSTTVFGNTQESHNTANESFTLGFAGGDSFNSLTGLPAGALPAGHSYRLTYSYILSHPMGDGSGASAHGFLDMELSLLPEPATLALCAMAWAAMSRRGARRR